MHGRSPTPTAKRASVLAEMICADVEAHGWQPGARLGNEADLIQRYGVSRAVLRETIGLLEYRGAVEVRRGHSGGVYVGDAPDEVAIRVMTAHLRALNIDVAEVFEARQLVEGLAVALAATRIDESAALRLRHHVEHSDPFATSLDFHDAIAAVSGNPLVAVTAHALRRVLHDHGPGDFEPCDESRASARMIHRQILETVIGGDAPSAAQLMSHHLDAFQATVDQHRAASINLDPTRWRELIPQATDRERLAPRLARFIVAETRSLPVGESLGSEPNLLRRYQVSRAVLRETVRILEYDGVAEMRRGPGGGLTLLAANSRSATVEFERFASYLKLSASQIGEFLTAIELGCLDLAMSRLDQAGRELLERTLERENSASEAEFDGTAFHLVLSQLSHNRALGFIFAALRRTLLKRLRPESPSQMRFFTPHARGAHDGIVAAMLAGDRPLAQLRMREHVHQSSAMFAPITGPVDVTPQVGQFAFRLLAAR